MTHTEALELLTKATRSINTNADTHDAIKEALLLFEQLIPTQKAEKEL